MSGKHIDITTTEWLPFPMGGLQRLATGPLKTPGDWPGYFFRGDEALALAQKCRLAVEHNTAKDELLLQIAERLEGCRI